MSQSVITTAFERWKAQQAIAGHPVILDEFVLAYVPGLDHQRPADRSEGLPPDGQIVHRQAVNKTGVINENTVVYSVTLGTGTGDFTFNWVGLINKASGTPGMIVHIPEQRKIANAQGQQGNALTRSFLMEYQGAATETAITVPAQTWQIDFTARLTGIDDRQRLINLDHYGPAAFFADGFLVAAKDTQFFVTRGTGYIGGLRACLRAHQIISLPAKATKVWADVSHQGDLTSQGSTLINITLAQGLENYSDRAGVAHYVSALAAIDAAGNITDLRPRGSLIARQSERYLHRADNLSDLEDKAAALAQLRGVPRDRKINGYVLSADISLSARDVKALAKEQNGADIADNAAFINNLGLRETVNLAADALPERANAVSASRLQTARKINGVAFDGSADITLPSEVPAGIPLPWPAAVPPAGWLKCDGAAFNKAVYPGLAQAYPSGVLPDLRGEFIRGWDGGRNTDAGRALLSSQGDAIRNITGFVSGAGGVYFDGFSGAFYDSGARNASRSKAAIQVPCNDDFVFDASRVVPTANENRPRNIAFNYIVRAA